MTMNWPSVALADVLSRADRFEVKDELTEYQFAGTYSFGRGIFLGERKEGNTFNLSKLQRIRKNDFVYCKIMAWEGAFGVAPKEVDGCVMSGAFVVYEIDKEKLDPRFIDYYFKVRSVWEKIGSKSTGTNVRRRSLHPDVFEKTQIPLPSLSEQRRIVAKIDRLAAKIEEAYGIRNESFSQTNGLRAAVFRKAFETREFENPNDTPISKNLEQLHAEKTELIKNKEIKNPAHYPEIRDEERPFILPKRSAWVRLETICHSITDGTHQTPTYTDSGQIFLSAQNIKPYRFMPETHRFVSQEDYERYISKVKPEAGDILMTRVGAGIGETALIDRAMDFAIYVSLCLIKPLTGYDCSEFLVHWLNSPYGARASKERTLGRGFSQGNLNLNFIRQFVIPFPPIEEQQRIIDYLDGLQSKVAHLKTIQDKTAVELDAMIPSILDKAFKGEL